MPNIEEPGLLDVSAFLPIRAAAKTVMSTRVGDVVKNLVPDPKIWRAAREAKNTAFNKGMYGASGAALGDELLRN